MAISKTKVVRYHQRGNPLEVIRVEEEELPSLGPDDILVKMQAASINPADINMIEGTYAILPSLPAVAGWEGIGVVAEIGKNVSNIKIGQQVGIPYGVGSWREAYVAKSSEVTTFSHEMPPEQGAMITVNPPTAWRMLEDFVQLKSGDWIIQNGANSAVGRLVIQIAKSRGIHTINVVRREELIPELKADGADVVVTESHDLRKSIAEWTKGSPILLGFNTVGGESALNIAKVLSYGGTLVTYGGMSKQPVRIPTGLLIFKDLRFRGYWLSKWKETADKKTVRVTFDQISKLIAEGKLKMPIEKTYRIDGAQAAVAHAMKGERKGKILFKFD
jgi:trans-2-enoyl-CoA reductase